MKPIRLTENTFFFSDLHLRHDRDFILHPRGYGSLKNYENDLVEYWNDTVNEDSTVVLLGDILCGDNSPERNKGKIIKEFVESVNCARLFIMPGNHYSGFYDLLREAAPSADIPFSYRLEHDDVKIFLLPNYFEFLINEQLIVCSHYPIMSWNAESKGAWHLFGHCHGNLKSPPAGKALELCPEVVGMRPLSFDALANVLSEAPIIHSRDR